MTTPYHQIPWVAVYAADTKGNIVDTQPLLGRSTIPWRLASCEIATTRYWSCSTARLRIARPILAIEDRRLNLREEILKILAPQDPIAIHVGLASVQHSDNPKDIEPPSANYKGNRQAPGYRRFFGYVDTVRLLANDKMVQLEISLRDPMRFLLENKFSGNIWADGLRIQTQTGFQANREGATDFDIRDVEDAFKLGQENSELYQRLQSEFLFSDLEATANVTPPLAVAKTLSKHKVLGWLIYAGSNGMCSPAPLVDRALDPEPLFDAQGKQTNVGQVAPDPAFETTSRPIVIRMDAEGQTQSFNCLNEFPMDVIKHVGSMEAEPRELWADPNTGVICFRKRLVRRQHDPHVLAYLVDVVDSKGNRVAPNVHAFDASWSSVGVVTEVIIINPVANTRASAQAQPGSGVFSLSARLPDNRFFPELIPEAFPGLRNMPRTTRFVMDDTATPDDVEGAQGLGENLLTNWGKDLRAATVNLPWKPDIECGDAAQLYNFGLMQDGEVFRTEAVTWVYNAGNSKKCMTQIAVAEPSESRLAILRDLQGRMGASGFFYGDSQNERPASLTGAQNYSGGNFNSPNLGAAGG